MTWTRWELNRLGCRLREEDALSRHDKHIHPQRLHFVIVCRLILWIRFEVSVLWPSEWMSKESIHSSILFQLQPCVRLSYAWGKRSDGTNGMNGMNATKIMLLRSIQLSHSVRPPPTPIARVVFFCEKFPLQNHLSSLQSTFFHSHTLFPIVNMADEVYDGAIGIDLGQYSHS